MNLNKVELIGNLTENPISKETPEGKKVVLFTLATSRRKKDAGSKDVQQTDFHRIVAWGKLGDVVTKYLKQGDRVYVDGQLRVGKSKRNPDVERVTIVINNLIMLGSKRQEEKSSDDIVVEEIEIKKGEG